jgi:choline-glycine betaine transporter
MKRSKATRALRRLLWNGALMLGASAAVLLVSGGWQAVCMAVAIFASLPFLLSFMSLLAANDKPRSVRPAWARETERRAVPAARPAPDTTRVPAARRRPARGRLSSAPS